MTSSDVAKYLMTQSTRGLSATAKLLVFISCSKSGWHTAVYNDFNFSQSGRILQRRVSLMSSLRGCRETSVFRGRHFCSLSLVNKDCHYACANRPDENEPHPMIDVLRFPRRLSCSLAFIQLDSATWVVDNKRPLISNHVTEVASFA